MLAHWHGQVWNASEFARSFGVADTTARRYLDVLSSAMVVRQLQPYHVNLAKRQVKAPKVYLRDSGILHRLLGIDNRHALLAHPKSGASWEGLVLETLLGRLRPQDGRAYFWKAHTGAEIDLLFPERRLGIEIKRSAAPRLTPSARTALRDLELEEVIVIHAGDESYPLAKQVRAVAAARMETDLKLWR